MSGKLESKYNNFSQELHLQTSSTNEPLFCLALYVLNHIPQSSSTEVTEDLVSLCDFEISPFLYKMLICNLLNQVRVRSLFLARKYIRKTLLRESQYIVSIVKHAELEIYHCDVSAVLK